MKKTTNLTPSKGHQESEVSELVITMNKARKLSLLLVPVLTLIVFDGFSKVYTWSSRFTSFGGYVLKIALLVTCILVLAFLSIRFFQTLLQYLRKVPAAIVSHDGLWLAHYGLISWANVAMVEAVSINPWSSEGEDMRCLGIRFKDPNLVVPRTWLTRMVHRSLQRTPRKYHVMLTRLDVDCTIIADRAQQFMR